MHSSSSSSSGTSAATRPEAHPRALTALAQPLALILLLAACHSSNAHEARIVADSDDLAHTELVAGLDAPLAPGANSFWCASLAFAWQALEAEVGVPLRFAHTPPAVDWIRATELRATDIAASAVFTTVGRGPAALQQVRDAVAAAGLEWDRQDSALADSATTALPLTFFAYARLTKALPFAKRFDDFSDWSLEFHTSPEETTAVDAFGLYSFASSSNPKRAMAEQVRVHHYTGRENFVVELIPRGEVDRIFVARLPRPATLRGAWDALATRLVAEPERLLPGDSLVVPELDLRLVQRYPSLVGLRFQAPGLGEQIIGAVVQDLELRLDEEGMVVRSRAVISAEGEAIQEAREMICDGPFLIAAMEADDDEPYFVAWIAHPEVLIEQAQEQSTGSDR